MNLVGGPHNHITISIIKHSRNITVPLLGGFLPFQWINIFGAFSKFGKDAWFYSQTFNTPDVQTVHATVEYMAKTFMGNGKIDPRYEENSNLARLLQIQYKGYKNMDR